MMSDEEHHHDERQDQEDSKECAKDKTDDDDETLTQVSELSQNKPQHKSNTDEDEKKLFMQKLFEEELMSLQKSLKAESENIHAPPVQEHAPYCFNALRPYYDTKTAEHVILKTGTDGKLKNSPLQYSTRNTAIGLVDPWVSNKMDVHPGSPITVKKQQPFPEPPKKEKKVGEGSTMIPVYPHVDMDTPDLASRKLDYSDVPMLRKELREKYSSQGKAKIESDYERTKVDFYRMELHKLGDVHPISRDNMKAAYFAYLQNTPGSKKALKECVSKTEGGDKEKTSEEKSEGNEMETSSGHDESGGAEEQAIEE